MPVDFGVVLVAPLLPQFVASYPEISVDCDVSPQRIDMILGNFDVALRLGELPDSTLVAPPLTRLSTHVYAAPQYLERQGTPHHPTDLAAHECVRILGPRRTSNWTFRSAGTKVDVEVHGRLALNNMGMLCRLVANGVGIGVLAEQIAHDDIRTGRLVRLLPAWSSAPFPVVAITAAQAMPTVARVFIDFLREKFSESMR